jgi:hypothetical protein
VNVAGCSSLFKLLLRMNAPIDVEKPSLNFHAKA